MCFGWDPWCGMLVGSANGGWEKRKIFYIGVVVWDLQYFDFDFFIFFILLFSIVVFVMMMGVWMVENFCLDLRTNQRGHCISCGDWLMQNQTAERAWDLWCFVPNGQSDGGDSAKLNHGLPRLGRATNLKNEDFF